MAPFSNYNDGPQRPPKTSSFLPSKCPTPSTASPLFHTTAAMLLPGNIPKPSRRRAISQATASVFFCFLLRLVERTVWPDSFIGAARCACAQKKCGSERYFSFSFFKFHGRVGRFRSIDVADVLDLERQTRASSVLFNEPTLWQYSTLGWSHKTTPTSSGLAAADNSVMPRLDEKR